MSPSLALVIKSKERVLGRHCRPTSSPERVSSQCRKAWERLNGNDFPTVRFINTMSPQVSKIISQICWGSVALGSAPKDKAAVRLDERKALA